MRTFLLLILGSILAGCIASNRIQLDSPIPAAPDFRAACAWSWPDTVDEFRLPVTGISNPGWAYYSQGDPWLEPDELELGAWLGNRIAMALADCAGNTEFADQVELVIYYASYELPLRARNFLDIVTVVGTAGSVPVDESEGYLLCLEVSPTSGELRHALATGRIMVDLNLWGGGRQDAKGHAMVRRMLQTLAQSAWAMLWIEPAAPGTREIDCQAEIAAVNPGILH